MNQFSAARAIKMGKDWVFRKKLTRTQFSGCLLSRKDAVFSHNPIYG